MGASGGRIVEEVAGKQIGDEKTRKKKLTQRPQRAQSSQRRETQGHGGRKEKEEEKR
jgi:hypothetical protein